MGTATNSPLVIPRNKVLSLKRIGWLYPIFPPRPLRRSGLRSRRQGFSWPAESRWTVHDEVRALGLRERFVQAAQEQSDVTDDADRLACAAVGYLGDNGRVDVHADELDPCGEHVAGRDGVQHGS